MVSLWWQCHLDQGYHSDDNLTLNRTSYQLIITLWLLVYATNDHSGQNLQLQYYFRISGQTIQVRERRTKKFVAGNIGRLLFHGLVPQPGIEGVRCIASWPANTVCDCGITGSGSKQNIFSVFIRANHMYVSRSVITFLPLMQTMWSKLLFIACRST